MMARFTNNPIDQIDTAGPIIYNLEEYISMPSAAAALQLEKINSSATDTSEASKTAPESNQKVKSAEPSQYSPPKIPPKFEIPANPTKINRQFTPPGKFPSGQTSIKEIVDKLDAWNFDAAPETKITRSDITSREILATVMLARRLIAEKIVKKNNREVLREKICWLDWNSLINEIGPTAFNLWKTVLISELSIDNRFTYFIKDPDLLAHLKNDRNLIEDISKAYIVRLKKSHEYLFRLLEGDLADRLTSFEWHSMLAGHIIIPAIMHGIIKHYGTEFIPVEDFVINRTRFETMMQFIRMQTEKHRHSR